MICRQSMQPIAMNRVNYGRARAALVHLACSVGVAALAAVLVFGLWYPQPFAHISGGQELFSLIVSIDVVAGPILTLLVFNPRKPAGELWTDITVVAALQLAALLYGLWTVYTARPVYLVHEVDRFQVVTAADIDSAELHKALPELRRLPRDGYRVIGVRRPRTEDEKLDAIELAMRGMDVSMRPDWWQPLGDAHRQILRQRGKPLSAFEQASGFEPARVRGWLAAAQAQAEDVRVFPVMARSADWSVLVHVPSMRILGFQPVDGFDGR